MRLSIISAALSLPFLLTACTSVTQETAETLTVDGKTYPILTRTFQTEQGNATRTYLKTTLAVGATRTTCDPQVAGQCEKIIRRAEQGDLRRTVDSPVNANIFDFPFGL